MLPAAAVIECFVLTAWILSKKRENFFFEMVDLKALVMCAHMLSVSFTSEVDCNKSKQHAKCLLVFICQSAFLQRNSSLASST